MLRLHVFAKPDDFIPEILSTDIDVVNRQLLGESNAAHQVLEAWV
jgi:hypothetical protein